MYILKLSWFRLLWWVWGAHHRRTICSLACKCSTSELDFPRHWTLHWMHERVAPHSRNVAAVRTELKWRVGSMHHEDGMHACMHVWLWNGASPSIFSGTAPEQAAPTRFRTPLWGLRAQAESPRGTHDCVESPPEIFGYTTHLPSWERGGLPKWTLDDERDGISSARFTSIKRLDFVGENKKNHKIRYFIKIHLNTLDMNFSCSPSIQDHISIHPHPIWSHPMVCDRSPSNDAAFTLRAAISASGHSSLGSILLWWMVQPGRAAFTLEPPLPPPFTLQPAVDTPFAADRDDRLSAEDRNAWR